MPETVGYACDTEESEFRQWLLEPSASSSFRDVLYARTADAVADQATKRASPLDAAVLIRQVLRRLTERDGRPATIIVRVDGGLDREVQRTVGIWVLERDEDRMRIEALPFTPTWLDGDLPVDVNAAAGSAAGQRAIHQNLPGDPIFVEATGFGSYRSSGQRAAIRAAVAMPDDGTLVALLPTGSGKTEIAVVLAHLSRHRTTVIVVPTLALAYDFERRFRHIVARLHPRARSDELDFAWTNETDSHARDRFKALLVQGKLPFLVTSPESMTGALLNTLRSAADGGRLAALVIDEAHLVTQWGRDFRPEFRQLSNLRHDLLARTRFSGHAGFKTILLSATLGELELADLRESFMDGDHSAFVAANVLRPEPDYWVAPTTERSLREERVLEAVKLLPRPLIVYVTSPVEADLWVGRIRNIGFMRTATVTGKTPGFDRRDVLHGLRAGPGSESRYDVVVATSAFGLGIDNDQVRSVIHACLPETVDRWYQEVGRAGRDGHASAALLLPAYGDLDEAASLGVTMLKPQTAYRRWSTMWDRRADRTQGTFVDLHAAPRGTGGGSYSRRWNAQVLRGLQELGQIARSQLSIDQAAALELPLGDPENPHEWERITLLTLDAQSPTFFEQTWDPWRASLLDDSRNALDAMTKAAQPGASVCWLLAAAYDPGPAIRGQFGVSANYAAPLANCGRCPGCRADGIPEHLPDLPMVPNRWPATDGSSEELRRLVAAAPTGENLALVVAGQPQLVAPSLASALIGHGVRFFAGVEIDPTRSPSGALFVDSADVTVDDVPPVAALIVPDPDEPVSQRWLVAGERARFMDGTCSPVIMLVSETTPIGATRRPASALPHLKVAVAVAMLGV